MMKKLILGVAIVFAALGYQKTCYNCDESQLITENVEALSQQEEKPQQPDVKDCVEEIGTTCIALHPTDPSKDIERPDAAWR
ncbi:MAG: hypothetical protein J6B92_05705 [Paraprevotella sp.]|nr:hypothetical protein [Paraprevotella sp.]